MCHCIQTILLHRLSYSWDKSCSSSANSGPILASRRSSGSSAHALKAVAVQCLLSPPLCIPFSCDATVSERGGRLMILSWVELRTVTDTWCSCYRRCTSGLLAPFRIRSHHDHQSAHHSSGDREQLSRQPDPEKQGSKTVSTRHKTLLYLTRHPLCSYDLSLQGSSCTLPARTLEVASAQPRPTKIQTLVPEVTSKLHFRNSSGESKMPMQGPKLPHSLSHNHQASHL
jgi:hypothetical protein